MEARIVFKNMNINEYSTVLSFYHRIVSKVEQKVKEHVPIERAYYEAMKEELEQAKQAFKNNIDYRA